MLRSLHFHYWLQTPAEDFVAAGGATANDPTVNNPSLLAAIRVAASLRYARAISPRLGLGVIAEDEDEAAAAKELLGDGTRITLDVGSAPAALAARFSLALRTSGSMIPNLSFAIRAERTA